MPEKTYRAVFFDLDGTLLPIDLDAFMSGYFKALGAHLAPFGIARDDFMAGMRAGIMAMVANDSGKPNADAFWNAFFAHVLPTAGGEAIATSGDGAASADAPTGAAAPGEHPAAPTKSDLVAAIAAFYETDFGALGRDVQPNPAAARAIETLAAKGYPLALTTMPMFPRRAVEWRLTWAGVDPKFFSRITTFDNSTAVKPKLNYYAENLAAAGLAGADVLMVGNNTKEDMAACKLGCDGYLVTDYLIDPEGFDASTVRSGSLEDFAAWTETLPICENPAQNFTDGEVTASAREAALAAAGIADGAAGGSKTLAEAGASGGANFMINGME